jgi:serine/threonine-protein kinase RsbW
MDRDAFAFERAIPSDVQYIEGIVAEVAAGCAELGYPPRLVRWNLRLALTEALANAIRCGNGARTDAFVRIRLHADADGVVVEVADDGPGFDLDACLVDPTTPDRLEREDGRGLFLMRHLVQHLEQYMDGGNVVRFAVRPE